MLYDAVHGIANWSTSFWINDSMNIIGDDGSYERFKIVEGKMQRVVHSIKLVVTPHWMLRAKSSVWVLSQTVSEGRNVDLTHVSRWRPNSISMGNISLDKSAIKIFQSEAE